MITNREKVGAVIASLALIWGANAAIDIVKSDMASGERAKTALRQMPTVMISTSFMTFD